MLLRASTRTIRMSSRQSMLRPLRKTRVTAWPGTRIGILVRPNAFSTTALLHRDRRSRDPQTGLTTPVPDTEDKHSIKPESPYYFLTGYAGWAKRPSRPFPPPFFSPPSGSFSDPLSTHNRSRDRRLRAEVNGEMILGVTNGDDAMESSEMFIAVNDGVGAWAKKERGHAPLWSRLVVHFWARGAEEDEYGMAREGQGGPKPVEYLSEAYARTKEALSGAEADKEGEEKADGWLGTTTACSALLHAAEEDGKVTVKVYVTQLGDGKVLILRPSEVSQNVTEDAIIFSTKEQWHYFDCPRQLGTNSPDTPEQNAVLDIIPVEENDLVLAMSDGVTDNLWEHEIAASALKSLAEWQERQGDGDDKTHAEGMKQLAETLVLEARKIAEDPFAESPYMEKAVEEGLAIEGGKLDDISVVAGFVRKRKKG